MESKYWDSNDGDLEVGINHNGNNDSIVTPITTLTSTDTSSSPVYTYRWEGVSCRYGSDKWVLRDNSGGLRSGELVAILGPSGSGKTTLLDILTLRKSVGTIEGQVFTDDGAVTQELLGKHGSYMPQEVLLLPMQTVEEALTFQANIRLGRSLSRETIKDRVATLLQETGLGARANQRIGGILPGGISIKGLSGGEKKRLGLCCCVIHYPELLFIDEATSGLDSKAALQIMNQVRGYCKRGVMCLTTIHQPRSAIWQLFDKVIILSKGYQLYYGPRSGAEPWFTGLLGMTRDPETAVVDWLLDVVNTDFQGTTSMTTPKASLEADTKSGAGMLTEDNLPKAASAFSSSTAFQVERASWPPLPQDCPGLSDILHRRAPSRWGGSMRDWMYCYSLLLHRSFQNCIRNPGNFFARVFCTTFVALVSGLVFYQVDTRSKSPLFDIQLVTCFEMLIFGTAVTPFAAISLFINDRASFMSDSASGLYPTSAYYLANMTVEIMLAIVNGVLFTTICNLMTCYTALFPPGLKAIRFVETIGMIIVSSMVGSSMVQFFAVASPNFDVAFILNASNVTFALLTGGIIVFYPNMSTVSRWMTNLSFIRFLFQALAQRVLLDTPHANILKVLELMCPNSVAYNLLISFLFYFSASFGSYLCLRFLHKEKR